MQIHFLSPAEEASFSEMLHSGSELADMFGHFVLQLGMDTDYDEVMVSFDGDSVVCIGIEDSPYTVVLDETQQCILLEQEGVRDSTEEVFDEDGLDSIVDIISSRILGAEDYGI